LVASGVACEIDTRVSIVDEHNPPKFKLSGNGTLITFFVYGLFATPEGAKVSLDQVKPIWQFGVGLPGAEIRDVPVITYGETPVGFYQMIPTQGAPPALEEGKFYMVTPLSGNANWEALCFTVRGGQTLKATCP
jgi:hypothetical protein